MKEKEWSSITSVTRELGTDKSRLTRAAQKLIPPLMVRKRGKFTEVLRADMPRLQAVLTEDLLTRYPQKPEQPSD